MTEQEIKARLDRIEFLLNNILRVFESDPELNELYKRVNS